MLSENWRPFCLGFSVLLFPYLQLGVLFHESVVLCIRGCGLFLHGVKVHISQLQLYKAIINMKIVLVNNTEKKSMGQCKKDGTPVL